MRKRSSIYLESVRRAGKRLRLKNLALQDAMAVKEGGLVKIPLTRGMWAIVDEADYQLVKDHKWNVQKSPCTFYARCRSKKDGVWQTIMMHRLILKPWFKNEVDHKDGNGLNNTRSNIRECTGSQNQMNRIHKNATGFRGVTPRHCSFVAYIRILGKKTWLGTFKTALDAAKAYNAAAIKHHGEFAGLNPIPESDGTDARPRS